MKYTFLGRTFKVVDDIGYGGGNGIVWTSNIRNEMVPKIELKNMSDELFICFVDPLFGKISHCKWEEKKFEMELEFLMEQGFCC
jgi:hypothetical protein